MKTTIAITLTALASLPLPALAQSAFTGTWKTDVSTFQAPKAPDIFSLKDNSYTCATCAPAYTVPADGAPHAVTGHPYYDAVAIKVVDDHTIKESDSKAGKPVIESTTTISADNKILNFEFTDSSNTNAAPVSGKGTATRVGKAGPKGAHAVTGSWRVSTFNNMSDNGLTQTFKVAGGTLSMSTPTGQSYEAKLDGTDSPYKGDPGTTSVSVKAKGKTMIVETDKRDGKVIGIATMTVSKDGKTLSVSYADKLRGRTSTYKATKQD